MKQATTRISVPYHGTSSAVWLPVGPSTPIAEVFVGCVWGYGFNYGSAAF